MITDTDLPTDRKGRELWVADRVELIAAVARRRLRAMVVKEYAEFVESIVAAAGDLSLFDDIPSQWLTVVQGELIPMVGETYLAGSVTAWLGLPAEPTAEFASRWAAVTNEAALSYMDVATNRLAGVGDLTWGLVKAKASDAMAKGLSNEALRVEIESVSSFTEYRADTIARTETVGAYVQGDMAGARALGANGPVEKVWVAALDARTRDDHAEAHDQCVPIDAMFDVGGEMMDAPHDQSATPGNVVNCRCIVEFLYAGDTRPDGSTVEAVGGVAGEIEMGDNEG